MGGNGSTLKEPDVQLALLTEAGPLVVDPGPPFLTFELRGEPRAWSRARAQIRSKDGRSFIHFFMDSHEADYRDALAWQARAALRSKPPSDRPIAVLIHVFAPIAQSWNMREKADARAGASRPTSKPDADNFAKIIGDSLNNIAWFDDSQIVDLRVIKRYSERPAMRVEAREFVSPK
jgi:Holliday junction resolvase RusA-like endonuclease